MEQIHCAILIYEIKTIGTCRDPQICSISFYTNDSSKQTHFNDKFNILHVQVKEKNDINLTH